MDFRFRKQVALILRILPEIAKERDFALHGGTAINLFYHNLPRLSIDIDLTLVSFGERNQDISLIKEILNRITVRLLKSIPSIQIQTPSTVEDEMKVYCSIPGAMVKIEVNTVNRGINGIPMSRILCANAQQEFDSFCEILVVPDGQLFGGKIVAALDRQHPRDLFDVKILLEGTGYTEEIHEGFLFSILSTKRPLHEILNPRAVDQKAVLESQFSGMTNQRFTYKMYEDVREMLITNVHSKLTADDKALLLSFAKGKPEWTEKDFGIFPGIQWKLLNIDNLKNKDRKKFNMQIGQLEDVLNS